MKPSKSHELTNRLCAEVTQKIEALEKTLTAQGITSTGNLPTSHGNPLTTEQHTLLAERVWWEKAQKGLEGVRSAIEEAEEYAHQRGANYARISNARRYGIRLLLG